jgi:hypothetical protein
MHGAREPGDARSRPESESRINTFASTEFCPLRASDARCSKTPANRGGRFGRAGGNERGVPKTLSHANRLT